MFKKRNINIRQTKNQLSSNNNEKSIRIRTVKKSKMVEMEMEFLSA